MSDVVPWRRRLKESRVWVTIHIFFCPAVGSKGEMTFQLSITDLGSTRAIGKYVTVVAFSVVYKSSHDPLPSSWLLQGSIQTDICT